MSLDVSLTAVRKTVVYDWQGLTHNLARMADEAGLYLPLWKPVDLAIKHANQLIDPLRVGLDVLKQDPERFKKLNPANGWGTYDGFVEFVADYLAACEANPDAEVSVDR